MLTYLISQWGGFVRPNTPLEYTNPHRMVRRSLHTLKHVSLCRKAACSTTYCSAVRKALAHAKTCDVKGKVHICMLKRKSTSVADCTPFPH